MSYCRPGNDCDFYVYPNSDGTVSVDCCDMNKIEALNFLKAQRQQGYSVPQYAIDRLKKEIDEENE